MSIHCLSVIDLSQASPHTHFADSRDNSINLPTLKRAIYPDQVSLTKSLSIGILARSFFARFRKSLVANSAQSKKRARQAEVRRQRNASQRSAMRTAIKKTISAIQGGDQAVATAAYASAVPIIDRAVTHGLIHKNKASRHKSRLNAAVKAIGA